MPTGLTAASVAELVGGTLIGRHDVALTGVRSLTRAGPHDLTFLTSARFLAQLAHTTAGAVLLPLELREAAGPATRILVNDPAGAAHRVLTALVPPSAPGWGVHPSARIGAGSRWSGRVRVAAAVTIGRHVRLGDGCVLETGATLEDGVVLGAGCRIGAHALVGRGSRLGAQVVLQPGARVGTPGFAFVPGASGHERTPHVGGCVLGDGVEVGANTTVDRGKLDDTVIGAGTKIDNLVQVGHNVRIGARCLIMAQVGIAGSTVVEDDVLLGGQAGLADHLTVGRAARVAAQAGVIGDVAPGATVSGYPARSHRAVLRQAAALARLAPLVHDLEGVVRRNGR